MRLQNQATPFLSSLPSSFSTSTSSSSLATPRIATMQISPRGKWLTNMSSSVVHQKSPPSIKHTRMLLSSCGVWLLAIFCHYQYYRGRERERERERPFSFYFKFHRSRLQRVPLALNDPKPNSTGFFLLREFQRWWLMHIWSNGDQLVENLPPPWERCIFDVAEPNIVSFIRSFLTRYNVRKYHICFP